MNTPSYVENANAKPLNKPMVEWFVKHFLKSPAEAQDPRINLVAADLKGLTVDNYYCSRDRSIALGRGNACSEAQGCRR